MFKITVIVLSIAFLLVAQPISGAYAEVVVTIPEKPTPKDYSVKRVTEAFGEGQWEHFNGIINKESEWNHLAQNRYSSAFGLCQFLNSTWKSGSFTKTSDPYLQIEACIEYIKIRYKTPEKALAFHKRIGWF